MAKFEVDARDVRETIDSLKIYRSGWANEIREGWSCGIPGAKEILYELYEISGTIILAMENRLNGNSVDRCALCMTEEKLEKFVNSKEFDKFSSLSEIGACGVIRSGTKHHIRVMFECLEVLLSNN